MPTTESFGERLAGKPWSAMASEYSLHTQRTETSPELTFLTKLAYGEEHRSWGESALEYIRDYPKAFWDYIYGALPSSLMMAVTAYGSKRIIPAAESWVFKDLIDQIEKQNTNLLAGKGLKRQDRISRNTFKIDPSGRYRALSNYAPDDFWGRAQYLQEGPHYTPATNTMAPATSRPDEAAHEAGHKRITNWFKRLLGEARGIRADDWTYEPNITVKRPKWAIGEGRWPQRPDERVTISPGWFAASTYAFGGETGRDYAWTVPLIMNSGRLANEAVASIVGPRAYAKKYYANRSYVMPPRLHAGKRLGANFGTYAFKPTLQAVGLKLADLVQDWVTSRIQKERPGLRGFTP